VIALPFCDIEVTWSVARPVLKIVMSVRRPAPLMPIVANDVAIDVCR
jgi:hypothetical protein